MRTYFRIVIVLAVLSSVYGIMVPSLISMKDTGLVISGVVLAILTPPCLYVIYRGLSSFKDKK